MDNIDKPWQIVGEVNSNFHPGTEKSVSVVGVTGTGKSSIIKIITGGEWGKGEGKN